MLQHCSAFCPADGERIRRSYPFRPPLNTGTDPESLQPADQVRACRPPSPVAGRLHDHITAGCRNCPRQRRRPQPRRPANSPCPPAPPGGDRQGIHWPGRQMQRVSRAVRSRNAERPAGHFQAQPPPARLQRLSFARQCFHSHAGNPRIAARPRRVGKDDYPLRPAWQGEHDSPLARGEEADRRRQRPPGWPYSPARQTGAGRAGISIRIACRSPNCGRRSRGCRHVGRMPPHRAHGQRDPGPIGGHPSAHPPALASARPGQGVSMPGACQRASPQ